MARPARGEKEDITHLLVYRFKQLMSEGVLKPGEKLASERELAAEFRVARSSLRQAMKVLENMGVVTQRVGDGSYLNGDASAVLDVPMDFLFLLDDISLDDVTGLRLMIEPMLAAHAAQHATEESLSLMRDTLFAMELSGGDQLKLAAADLLFHQLICEASGNKLAMRVFVTIHRAMLNRMMVTSQLVDMEHTLGYHRAIYESIAGGSPETALSLMTSHLIDAEKLLVRRGKEESGGFGEVRSSERAARRRRHGKVVEEAT